MTKTPLLLATIAASKLIATTLVTGTLLTSFAPESYAQSPSPSSSHEEEVAQVYQRVYKDDAPAFSAKEAETYTLNPDRIYKIAKETIEDRNDDDQRVFFDNLIANLQQEFPEIDADNDWSINQNYGVTGHIKILYASPKEYLIIYGTNIGLSGITGRYDMNIRTILIDGQQESEWEGDPLSVHVHKTGDRSFLPKGKQKIYRLAPGWILECGQGKLWKNFPGLIFHNEWGNAKDQLKIAIRGLFR